MAQPQLVQVNLFKFLLDDLEGKGVNVHRLIQNSGLNKFNLDNSDNYVPVNSMYRLFERIAFEQGALDFLEIFGESIRVKNLDSYGFFMMAAPDLLSAAHLAIRYSKFNYTSQVDGLDIHGPNSKYWIRIDDEPVHGLQHAVELHLALLLDHIRLACGPDWVPLEIHVPLKRPPQLDSMLPQGHSVKLILNQPHLGCVFSTSILSKKVHGAHQEKAAGFPLQTLSLRGRIEQLLESTFHGFVPTLPMIAEFFDIPIRTLQLRLQEEGTSYFEIVDQWRFKRSINWLKDQRTAIGEISQTLGYQKVQSFHRAFQRWTNTTPQRYREAL